MRTQSTGLVKIKFEGMKKIISIIILVLLGFAANAQTEVMQWAKQFKGNGTEGGYRMELDSVGNVYICGHFNGTSDFDPGPAMFNLTPVNGVDAYIVKLNNAGDLLWAKQLGGFGNEGAADIKVDKAGNVYTVGYFDSTLDADPGIGFFNLNTINANDIFISKLDSTGNFVWAKHIGGTNAAYSNSLVLDHDGFLYIGGKLKGTVDFDPSVNVFNLSSVTPNHEDIFISKYDFTGNFIWAKVVGGGLHDACLAIAIDKNKNIYHAGQFQGSADFDPGMNTFYLTATGLNNQNAYFSKLDSNGNFIWAKQFEGNSNPSEIILDMAVNDSNQILLAGEFSYTVDFDPGPAIYNLYSPPMNNIVNMDSYVGKYDSAGNFIWIKQFSGTNHTYLWRMDLDTLGSIYLGGRYLDTSDFDPGPGQFLLTSNDYFDICMVKLNAAGDFQWAKSIGGNAADHCFDIITDKMGNVYSTGMFYATVDFDPGIDTFNLIAVGGNFDGYIHKLAQCDININTTLNNNIISAVATGSTYQWIDCNDSNTIIAGATAQSFAPAGNGMYAVIISVGNCRDTSQCVTISEIGVGVQEWSKDAECRIFPNPTNGEFRLVLNDDAEVTIINTMGEVILHEKFSEGVHPINMEHEANGLYFVKIEYEGSSKVLKLSKGN